MKNVLLGKESAFYSFGKSLGGSMIGIWAYYLLSPYNIIFVFFNESQFTEVLTCLIGLKIITCSITFYEFIKKKSENNILSMLLSIAYSLCGFVVAFQMNVMWLDGLIFLPIVCIGIDKVIKEKKFNLYILALCLSIISNFYVGFSICIFVAIYYIYSYIINYKTKNIKEIIKDFLTFALYSIVALAISSVIIVPVYFMLANGKGSGLTFNLSELKVANFEYIEILGKLLPGAINNNEIFYGLPNIYSGLLTIFLVEIFFINKEIKIKEKIASIILIFLMICMMHNSLINLIWHGLKAPTGFPYRYSFIFSFILLMIAGRGIKNTKNISVKKIIAISIINLFILFYILTRKYDYIKNISIYLSIMWMIFYEIMYIIYVKKGKKIFMVAIGIMFSLELLYNYCTTYKSIDYLERTPYVESVKEYEKIFDIVKEQDNSFYRIEKKMNFYLNDSLLCNYNGIGHSSSTFDNNVTNLLKQIGYNYYMDWPSYGTGNTLITDTIFGIKYKISKNETEENFEYLNDIEKYKLLKNKSELSLGYMTDDYIKKIEEIANDPFELQESFLNKLTNSNDTYFKNIKEENIEFSEVEKVEENNYKRINENSFIELNYDLKNVNNDNIYFYIKSSYYSDLAALKIYINDAYYNLYLGSNKMGILNINKNEWNLSDKLNIKIYFNTTENVNIENIELKVLDYEKFENAYNKLKNSQLENLNYKNNMLTANINVKESGYLSTTIPYENEWKVFVDGNEVSKIEDAEFITIKLDQGEHNVKFKYKTKGLKYGILIFIGGIIIWIGLNILPLKFNKISYKIFSRREMNKK